MDMTTTQRTRPSGYDSLPPRVMSFLASWQEEPSLALGTAELSCVSGLDKCATPLLLAGAGRVGPRSTALPDGRSARMMIVRCSGGIWAIPNPQLPTTTVTSVGVNLPAPLVPPADDGGDPVEPSDYLVLHSGMSFRGSTIRQSQFKRKLGTVPPPMKRSSQDFE